MQFLCFKHPSASLHIQISSTGLGKDLHNEYLLVEVNVDDVGIDCLGNDSKEVRNLPLGITAIVEFTILDDLDIAISE